MTEQLTLKSICEEAISARKGLLADNSVQLMNTPHTDLWCDVSQTIRPVQVADMHADDTSGLFGEASDLVRGTCGYVIAKLYVPKPKMRAIDALLSWPPRPRT